MANEVNFAKLLDKKYASYTVEVEAFLDTCQVSSSTEVAAQMIYDKIKDYCKVDSNLKILYHEAVFGSDKDVKACIKNRITHFWRTLR